MDVSATPPAAAPVQPPFRGQDRFDGLIDKINNTGGTYSQAEQLEAYGALHTMAVTGELVGMGEANQALYNAAKSTSAIGEQLKQVSQSYTLAMAAGAQSGGAAGASRAALDYYDRQGGADQAVLFQGHINAADMTGARPYADPDSWRTSMLAGILDLVGQRQPIRDKVDLSDAVKRVVGEAQASGSPGERTYQAGSVADRRV